MRDKLKGKNLLYLLLAVNVVLLGVNGFLFLTHNDSSAENANTQYPYLSKRIFTESQNDILINFTPLRQAMRDYVNKQNGNLGVYFEYLPSGTSVGVNDQMEVKIASLVKIPVIMAAYKTAEDGKLDLNKTMTIDQDDLDKSFGDLWKQGAGAKITVSEAINLMLTKSDNTATRVLTDELPEFAVDNVFDSLDLPKEREGGFAVISPKSYTSIMRSLYLSSYIQREHSNLILDALTKTSFSDKLPAGVPEEVAVAHKIGVYDQDSQHPVYSDCGVVYAPNRPYSLCVMTKDLDENTSRQHMQLLSKMVYGYVAQVK
jgi:beta-lactamase class A